MYHYIQDKNYLKRLKSTCSNIVNQLVQIINKDSIMRVKACQKDIEPFMRDLEEVYGMRIVKQQEIWSNPDKLSTMKYQTVNTNKNKR